jgi:hypothetical protein
MRRAGKPGRPEVQEGVGVVRQQEIALPGPPVYGGYTLSRQVGSAVATSGHDG